MNTLNILLAKLQARKGALKEIKELYKREEYIFVIHYSCESLYILKEGQTPRITSIAIRDYKSGQTQSFSIHKIAELENILPNNVEVNYNNLEKIMLEEFFEYLSKHKRHYWVHWNMRDINYGFQALEHRFRILGGNPSFLEDSHKFDLSSKIYALWGSNYIDHPRLAKLTKVNNITEKGFLNGDEEAKAFNDKEFVKLHQSTLRKVEILSSILERVFEGTLKTAVKPFNYFLLRLADAVELIGENFIFKAALILIAIVELAHLIW